MTVVDREYIFSKRIKYFDCKTKACNNGYALKANIATVSNSEATIVSGTGGGSVVLFADNPTCRGFAAAEHEEE